MFQNVARVRSMVPGQAPPDRRQQRRVMPRQQWPSRPVLPGARPSPGHRRSGTRTFSLDGLDGQVCGLFAVDIAGFNQACRDDDIQVYIHRSLYDMLKTAFDSSGLPWRECVHEDRGDGTLVVIPPSISTAALVHAIPDKLLGLVRRHNRVSCEAARIQLRVAAHLGPIHHDGHGFVGHDVNHLHRMLDAPALKRMLTRSGAEIAFITSGYFYENIVARRPSLVDPAVFKPLTVRVKETRAQAWVYTLGPSAASTV